MVITQGLRAAFSLQVRLSEEHNFHFQLRWKRTEEQTATPLDQTNRGSSRRHGFYFPLYSRWLNAGSFVFRLC